MGYRSGDPTKDILGKGLIVHQGTDDFVSSGNAGARVACSCYNKVITL
jgi:Cu-Zn family superoxide dismutase